MMRRGPTPRRRSCSRHRARRSLARPPAATPVRVVGAAQRRLVRAAPGAKVTRSIARRGLPPCHRSCSPGGAKETCSIARRGPTPLSNPCPRLDGDETKPDPFHRRLVLLSILSQHGRGERAGESEQDDGRGWFMQWGGRTMKDVPRGTPHTRSVAGHQGTIVRWFRK